MKECLFETKKEYAVTELLKAGVPQQQADIVSECFTTADLYGVTTHGTNVLPAHIKRIQTGRYNLSPKFKVVRGTASFAVIDGDNAMGPVSAVNCINYAMEKCKDSGIFTVLSKNNNTFGPAFYYSLLAAKKGYMCIAFSNSPAQMAPFGGKEKMLGTNPISFAIPCADKDPIILDMATSIVAKSRFKEYKLQGKQLPYGWAIDSEGKPTTDPDEAIGGFVQPMAGYKGYGIAMMLDVFSGVLSGAAYLNNVGRFYSQDSVCQNCGHTFILIDPKQVLGETYDQVITDFVDTIRNSENIPGKIISLPGDDRYDHIQNCKNKHNCVNCKYK